MQEAPLEVKAHRAAQGCAGNPGWPGKPVLSPEAKVLEPPQGVTASPSRTQSKLVGDRISSLWPLGTQASSFPSSQPSAAGSLAGAPAPMEEGTALMLMQQPAVEPSLLPMVLGQNPQRAPFSE